MSHRKTRPDLGMCTQLYSRARSLCTVCTPFRLEMGAFLFIYLHSVLLEIHLDIPETWYSPHPSID